MACRQCSLQSKGGGGDGNKLNSKKKIAIILPLFKRCVHVCSVMSDSVTPGTITRQAPLPMEFSRQEYWSGLSFPTPEGLPDPGIKWMSLTQGSNLCLLHLLHWQVDPYS